MLTGRDNSSARSQTIYLISPQQWDGIKVSKHHYAQELAGMGHTVYFIEPPDVSLPRGAISVSDTDVQRVRTVRYAPWFPYKVKFHARAIFDLAMRRQARLLAHAINWPPDLVWDFDNSWQFRTLKSFGAPRNILHLVDYFPPRLGHKDADLIILLSESFCAGLLTDGSVPILIEGHCLNRSFARLAQGVIDVPGRVPNGDPVRVGYFGNLDHPVIDWATLHTIASSHPQIEFELIGPGLEPASGKHPSGVAANQMRQLKNCRFPGLASTEELVEIASRIDVWLLCYDRRRDPNRGVNSHKILEYLATGSVCVSSRIEEYIGSNLIAMTDSPTNDSLSGLFANVVGRLRTWNAPQMRAARAHYALNRTYRNVVHRIIHADWPAVGRAGCITLRSDTLA
jgi:hypothetical protein